MHAAVYRGSSVVNVEEIPTPVVGPGEILRVDNDPSRPEAGSLQIRVEAAT